MAATNYHSLFPSFPFRRRVRYFLRSSSLGRTSLASAGGLQRWRRHLPLQRQRARPTVARADAGAVAHARTLQLRQGVAAVRWLGLDGCHVLRERRDV